MVCPGVQPGQIPKPFGSALINQPLVIAHFENQFDQDRSESGEACPLHLFPIGRDFAALQLVRGDLEKDPAVGAARAGVKPLEPERIQQEVWSDERGCSLGQYACPTAEIRQADSP